MTYFENVNNTRKRFLDSYKQGDYLRAVIWGEKLLTEQKEQYKMNTVEYNGDLFNVARAYDVLERYDKAILYYTESSKGIINRYGEDIRYVRVLNNLAMVYNKKGDFDKAHQLLKKACELCEIIHGKDCIEYADMIYNTANMYADQGNNDYALKLHFEVLSQRKTVSSDQVDSLFSICFVYEAMEDWTNAILYGEKTLSAIMKLKGNNSEELYKAMYYLAGLYESNQRYDTSIKLLLTVSRWMESCFSQQNPHYISCVNRIADLYCKTEDIASALSLRQKTLRLISETAGENHIYYANLLKNAALLSKDLNQRNEAESMLLQAIEIKQNLMGNDGYDYVDDLILLIGFYIEWNMLDKASDTLIYALGNISGDQEDIYDSIKDILIKLQRRDTEEDEQAL